MSNSNYMGSAFASTLDNKANNKMAQGINVAASQPNLSVKNYLVPSSDGQQIPAIPLHLALKFKPPTLAVVYITKDSKGRITLDKRGRHKKFHKQILIHFEKEARPINIR